MDITHFKTYPIEQIIDTIAHYEVEKEDLLQKLHSEYFSIEDKRLIETKITTAYRRIHEPLEWSLRLFYVFAPFGIVNDFSDENEVNFLRFKKYRYLTKIKQYYICSIIGCFMYPLIGTIAALYTLYYT